MTKNNFKEIRAALRLVSEGVAKRLVEKLITEGRVESKETLIEAVYKEFPYSTVDFVTSVVTSYGELKEAKKCSEDEGTDDISLGEEDDKEEKEDEEGVIVTEDEVVVDDDDEFELDGDECPIPKDEYYFIPGDDDDEEYEIEAVPGSDLYDEDWLDDKKFESASHEFIQNSLTETYYRIDADNLIKSLRSHLSQFKYAEDVINYLEQEAAQLAKVHVSNGEQVIAPSWMKVVDWATDNFPLRNESVNKEELANDAATNLLEEIAFNTDSDVVTENLKEGMASVVYKRAKGAVAARKVCPPGWKLAGNKCVMQTGAEKTQNRLTGVKIKRAAKARSSGEKARAALKSTITKRIVKGRSRNVGTAD